ncbi:hypothetical protein ABW20_dc0100397 [Dactylellina cionopaga]|nr:hypothetical protein ABW20_dc0100397 [Dactylellina cionopaga]
MRFSTALTTLLVSASLASAQSTTIDFSTIGVWPDLKKCLQAVFKVDYLLFPNGPVQKVIGCGTDECLCRDDTLQQAASSAASIASSLCTNSNDKTSASSIISQYCTDKGFVGNPAANPTNNAGAPVTVFATTTVAQVTVIQTVTVSSASELPSSSSVSVPSRTTTPPPASTPAEAPVTQTVGSVTTISGSPTTIFATVTSNPTQTNSSQTSNETPKKSSAGPIAGGVVGGIVVIAAIIGIVFWLRRKNNSPSAHTSAEQGMPPSYHKNATADMGGMEDGRVVGGIQMQNDKPYS